MNENELDDLFRQASEKYPLRTDSADWDKLARALDGDENRACAPFWPEQNKEKQNQLFFIELVYKKYN